MPEAPPFLVQLRIVRSTKEVLRHVPAPAPTAESVDIALVAQRVLGLVTADLGENFWQRLHLPPVPCPPPRPAPAGVPNAVCVWLSDEQRRIAETALWFCRLHAISSAAAAVRAYAAQCVAAEHAPRISECVEEFLAEKRARGQRSSQLSSRRGQLRGFVEKFGDCRPGEVMSKGVSGYLAGEATAARTPYPARGLSTFYEWAIRRRYALTNPVSPELKHQPVASRAPLIFTPRQARYILRQTRNTDQIGYWALSFFGGLRTTEIQRLQRHPSRWRLVRFRSEELVVPAMTPGKIDRIIKMQPALRDWLKWVRLRDAPFYPTNFWEKKFPLLWKAALRKFPDDRTTRSGFRRPPMPSRVRGIARSTHLAYRLAAAGANVDRIAYDVGDIVRQIRRYADPSIPPRRARDFFALTPTRI